jgi:hypothetical protein
MRENELHLPERGSHFALFTYKTVPGKSVPEGHKQMQASFPPRNAKSISDPWQGTFFEGEICVLPSGKSHSTRWGIVSLVSFEPCGEKSKRTAGGGLEHA